MRSDRGALTEEGLQLRLDLGLEARFLLLAAERLFALPVELGLDLVGVDPVRGGDLVLERADVFLELGGRKRPELETATLVDQRLDEMARPGQVRLAERAQPVLVRPGTVERDEEADETGIDLDALIAVSAWLEDLLGRRLEGYVYRAGPWPA